MCVISSRNKKKQRLTYPPPPPAPSVPAYAPNKLEKLEQVVQATSILFQNLRSPTSLYLLLSQDHINHLIQPEEIKGGVELPLDDEEFLTNYVALLKMISVRLSKDTVRSVRRSSVPPAPHTRVAWGQIMQDLDHLLAHGSLVFYPTNVCAYIHI